MSISSMLRAGKLPLNKLWVDDVRPVPDETWDVARNFHTAIYLLDNNYYDEVSLDHDLGIESFYGDRELTGRDILNWLIWRVSVTNLPVPRLVRCHSANPVASKTMIEDCKRFFSG